MECEERVWYSWNEDGEAEEPVPKLSWSRRKQFVALVLVSAATPEIRSNSSLVPGSCADGPVRQLACLLEFLPIYFFLSWISSLPVRLSSPCAGCAGSALAQGAGNALGGGCEEEVAPTAPFWGLFPPVPCLLVCWWGSVLQLTGCISRTGCISDWLQPHIWIQLTNPFSACFL